MFWMLIWQVNSLPTFFQVLHVVFSCLFSFLCRNFYTISSSATSLKERSDTSLYVYVLPARALLHFVCSRCYGSVCLELCPMVMSTLLKGEQLEGDLLALAWLQALYTAIGTLPNLYRSFIVEQSLFLLLYFLPLDYGLPISCHPLKHICKGCSLSTSHFGPSGVGMEADGVSRIQPILVTELKRERATEEGKNVSQQTQWGTENVF